MPKIVMDPADKTVLRETTPGGVRSFITPTPSHFVLAALGIPRLSAEEWTVTVSGAVVQPQILSLQSIRELPARTMIVTLECAGDPLFPDKPVRRVSTAKWRGVPLAHILELAKPLSGSSHVWIDGADWGVYRPGTATAERVSEYRKDLMLERVRRNDVLLAYEMNDEVLPPEHGFPLRIIVPGYYGTNSVKWVNKLVVAHGRPSGLFSSVLYNTADTVDGAIERHQVAEVQVNSMLTSHQTDDVVSIGTHQIVGWAWGVHEVERVEVRVGRDSPWLEAKVGPRIDHAWQPFEAVWTASQTGRYIIFVRATDSQGNVQPSDVHINQIARVEITVV
jgi:sulfane dehydrogenase subunit SoxC